MKIPIAALALAVGGAFAQTPIPPPTFTYAGGVLGINNYVAGSVTVPDAKIYEYSRIEAYLNMGDHTSSSVRAILASVDGSATGYAYGMTTLMLNSGPGLAVANYARAQGGTGPNIAHKTAVRCDAGQWACWDHQINMGPGAKAALWISGDNPEIEGRGFDTVPNVIVINDDLYVTGAAIQWNARTDATGSFLRVFNGKKLVFEVTRDGRVRARSFEYLAP